MSSAEWICELQDRLDERSDEIAQLRARLERVEKLEKKWRERTIGLDHATGINGLLLNCRRSCADELAAALSEKKEGKDD